MPFLNGKYLQNTSNFDILQPHVHIENDSDTDMIIDHRELSFGEGQESISTVSHGTTQNKNRNDITEVNTVIYSLCWIF